MIIFCVSLLLICLILLASAGNEHQTLSLVFYTFNLLVFDFRVETDDEENRRQWLPFKHEEFIISEKSHLHRHQIYRMFRSVNMTAGGCF